MANLPQRPPGSEDRRGYPPDDRHFPPMVSRVAPMRQPYHRDPISRPESDTYVPRAYCNSYDSHGRSRHVDDRFRDYREVDYRRDDNDRWQRTHVRDERRSWDREQYGRDNRRNWEKKDSWVAPDYDRDRPMYDREYDRERDRDPGIGRGGGNERPLSPRRDPPRLRRDTRTPPWRSGSGQYQYAARHQSSQPSPGPDRRRPSLSPRRSSHYRPHPSPSHTHDRAHSRSRSTAKSNSRSMSPPAKRIKLDDHSVSNSPRSPARSHGPSPHDSPRRPNLPHRLPRASRSQSPEQHIKDEPRDEVTSMERPPSPSLPVKQQPPDSPAIKEKTPPPTPPRSLSPAQLEEAQPPSQPPPLENKGKVKEEPSTDTDIKEVDPDVKIPSPPEHPTGAPPSVPVHQTSHSPPRGPRNHPKTPTAPASFYYPNAPTRDWSRRNNAMPSPIPPSMPMPAEGVSNPVLESEPVVKLPKIPTYNKPTTASITRDLDLDIARTQAHRAHLVSDYAQMAKATRRALHELDIATIDLRAAENRRKLADSQVEKARAGVLGIDAVPVN